MLSINLKKTLSLGLLYFVQGFPYGFQDKLIPLLLISKGHSPSSVAFTRLLLLPWLAKALFAPLIDTTFSKIKWVAFSLLCLASVCLFNIIHILPESSRTSVSSISSQLIGTLFLLNVFSAIQDIAVDAIAISVLSNGEEVASGNAGQIVGYKLGSFFGSGILFWFYSIFGWSGLFSSLFLVYMLVLVVFVCFTRYQMKEISISNGIETIKTSIEKDNRADALWNRMCNITINFDILGGSSPICNLMSYVFIYKIGESAATTTFPFFLSKCGVNSHQIVFWNGTVGIVCSIFGSIIASQFALTQLKFLIKFRLLPLLLQIVVIVACRFDWSSIESNHFLYSCSVCAILLLHLIGGCITTLTFTLMMFTCQKLPESFRATRYTLLSTIEVFGKLVFASLSGFLVDLVGFTWAHCLFLLLSIIPIYSVVNLNLKQISTQLSKKSN